MVEKKLPPLIAKLVKASCQREIVEKNEPDLFWRMDVHVETAACLEKRVLQNILSGTDASVDDMKRKILGFTKFVHVKLKGKIYVVLSYPLDKEYAFEFHMHKLDIPSIGDFVWMICNAYRFVYDRPSAFGVWGHSLDHLYIEGIFLDSKNQILSASIGS